MGAAAEKWELVQARIKTPGSVVLRSFADNRRAERSAWIGKLVERAASREMSRMFAASETPSFVSSWPTDGGNLNQNLERGLLVAVRRARQLTQDNDWARRYLLQMRVAILGNNGMPLSMRHTKRGSGEAHDAVNAAVETFWTAWGERGVCEVTGQHDWQACESLLLDHLSRDGEFLFRHLPGRGPMGYQIQLLDPLLLDPTYRSEYAGRRIRMSIELDDDNRRVAYWLKAQYTAEGYVARAYDGGVRVRVPAEEIEHFFFAEDADQLRGFPPMIAGMRRLRLIGGFEESAAVASENAAKRVGFFTSPNGNPEAPPGFAETVISAVMDQARAEGKILSPEEVQAIRDSASRYSTTVPGQYDTLPNGYTFTPFQSDYPHINYGEYVRECLRGFTAGVGLSHATAGNNLENVNMSSARVGILDERELYKWIQSRFVKALHGRVFPRALKFGLLASPLLARVPAAQLSAIVAAAVWVRRRWADPDPLKKANADEVRLRCKTTSPQRVIAENGDDPDEVSEEIADWEMRHGPLFTAPAAAPAKPDSKPAQADTADSAAEEGAEPQTEDDNA